MLGLCRQASTSRGRLDGMCGLELVEYEESEPGSLNRLLRNRRIVAAFNLAAYGVHGTQQDPQRMRATNEELIDHLLAAVPEDCPVVHIGSLFEYGGCPVGQALTEETPPRPFSEYGRSKVAGTERALQLAISRRRPLVVIRLSHVYGPGEAASRLTPYLIERLQRSESVDLTDGCQIRDFLFVDDAVEALLHAPRLASATPPELFNVCTGIPVTIREVGEELARLVDRPSSLLCWGARANRAGEPHWIVGDASKFQVASGWSPRVSLQEGLSATVQHLLYASHTTCSAPHRRPAVMRLSHESSPV